ncbi:hypothetical protein [Ruegeria spongiae]|uniref:hypothetical protein n=1 Tax=Ruegeria spongiae TaxID=2942209 RepID=UPI003570EFBA
MALVLGATLCMVAFHINVVEAASRSRWGHLFFVGLAIGILAKGPVAIVLTSIPIFLWLLMGNRWSSLAFLPRKTGIPVLATLTLPWDPMAPGNCAYSQR